MGGWNGLLNGMDGWLAGWMVSRFEGVVIESCETHFIVEILEHGMC